MGSRRIAFRGFGASVMLCCFLMSAAQTSPTFNITSMLEAFPNFSLLNQLLSSSGVADEINTRTSLTLLAPSDAVISAFQASNPNADAIKISDLLRYHVLLQFLGMDDLKALDTANYTSVTTLYQTTGKANENDGFLNIYNLPSGILIGPTVPGSTSNATVVTNITSSAFDISIIQIDRVLLPVGFNTAAGDLIKVLQGFNEYTLFINFLKSTGVDSIFAGRQTGGGVTVFAPKDAAFNALTSITIQDLSVTEQKLLMQYHGLTSYQTFAILETMINSPVQTIASTVATGYLLNVSAVAKKVSLHTGIVNPTILDTLYDARPTTMYSVDAVLVPLELVSKALVPAPAEAPVPEAAPTPATEALAPKTASVPAEAAPGPELPAGNAGPVAKITAAISVAAVLVASIVALL